MNKDDELREIMREMLDAKRDEGLARMSARDRRVVGIAQGISTREVQKMLAAQRAKALFWPFSQAMAASALLFMLFAFGFVQSLMGQSIGPLASIGVLICAALVMASVAQLTLQARQQ